MKKCSKCNLEKDISEYYFRKAAKRYETRCRKCVSESNRAYNIKNKEKKKIAVKKYYSEKREDETFILKRKQLWENWYERNKEKRREWKRKYKKNKRATDPVYKMRENISNAVNKMLKQKCSCKKGRSCLQFFSFTINELKQYLEKQFDENMSWENYGSYWQIDHIYPQSKLPYDSMEHPNFQKCWALENLRPLDAFKNNKKGNKI